MEKAKVNVIDNNIDHSNIWYLVKKTDTANPRKQRKNIGNNLLQIRRQ